MTEQLVNPWDSLNRTWAGVNNAIAGYKQRQLQQRALEQQAQQAAARQQAAAQQQAFENDIAARRLAMDERSHAQGYQKNAIENADAMRGQQVEKLKLGFHMMDKIKDQQSLDIARQTSAQLFGPQAAAELPEVWDETAAQQIAAKKAVLSGALKGHFKQKQFYLKAPDGSKHVVFANEGEDLVPEEGFELTTAPSDDLELQRIRSQGMIRREQIKQSGMSARAKADNAAELKKEREKIAAKKQAAIESRRHALKMAKFGNEDKLRRNFQGLPEVEDYNLLKPKYDQIQAVINDPDASKEAQHVADQSLIVLFKKMTDPTSAVMQGEVEMLPADRGLLDYLTFRKDKILESQALSQKERDAISRLSGVFMNTVEDRYNKQVDYYSELSNRYGLDGRNVVGLGETPEVQAAGIARDEDMAAATAFLSELGY